MKAFIPGAWQTTVTVTTTSQAVQLPTPALADEVYCFSVVGGNDVFLAWGQSGVVATASGAGAGYPLFARSKEVVSTPEVAPTHIALVAGAGTSVVTITEGRGQ